MYNRLPTADQRLLDGDRVFLFLKVVDMKERREFSSLLEDEKQSNDLVTDWAVVKRACNYLENCQEWLDEANIESMQSRRRKAPVVTKPNKEINIFNKKMMEETTMRSHKNKLGHI